MTDTLQRRFAAVGEIKVKIPDVSGICVWQVFMRTGAAYKIRHAKPFLSGFAGQCCENLSFAFVFHRIDEHESP